MNKLFQLSQDQTDIAVALSGGGDSMALAHMICVWAADNNRHIHLLTVNHNLRPEAVDEARQVGNWVRDFPASEHHILTWEHEEGNPTSAIMEKARQARYDLMTSYCQKNAIKTLAIAHHADDQLETFLFRLAKGSGLDGLTGMEEKADYKGVTLYRPCLRLSHQDLIEYCKDKGLQWVEDPSNHNTNYARPRLRKALTEEGLDPKRFAKTLERLARGRDALDDIAGQVLKELLLSPQKCETDEDCEIELRQHGKGNILLNFKKLQSRPLDIQIRVMQKALSQIGYSESGYPPKLERIEEIVQTIKPNKSATLFGCVLSLSKDGNTLEITRS